MTAEKSCNSIRKRFRLAWYVGLGVSRYGGRTNQKLSRRHMFDACGWRHVSDSNGIMLLVALRAFGNVRWNCLLLVLLLALTSPRLRCFFRILLACVCTLPTLPSDSSSISLLFLCCLAFFFAVVNPIALRMSRGTRSSREQTCFPFPRCAPTTVSFLFFQTSRRCFCFLSGCIV